MTPNKPLLLAAVILLPSSLLFVAFLMAGEMHQPSHHFSTPKHGGDCPKIFRPLHRNRPTRTDWER